MNVNQRMKAEQLLNIKESLLGKKSETLLKVLSTEECKIILKGAGVRNRIFTPLTTLYTFIKQVLSADRSCKNAVAGVIVERLVEEKSTVCTNTGSYVKARNRLPENSIYALVKTVGASCYSNVACNWKPYGRDLKAIDGTIITLPDTQKNNKAYPKHSNKKKVIGFPQIRLVAVLSLITGAVVDYALDASKGKGTGELSLLRRLLDSINEQDLVVADRLYCNFF